MTDTPIWFPDLALRTVGGAVVWANDDSFAEKENLIRPGPAKYQPATFGHRGQIYDGWETRRRRDRGHDEAIVRLAGRTRVPHPRRLPPHILVADGAK